MPTARVHRGHRRRLVWGRGKLEAVEAWAATTASTSLGVVRLQRQLLRRARCSARSAHPVAVNPDVRLAGLAPPAGLARAPLRPARRRAQDRRARAAGVGRARCSGRSCWPTSASTSTASRRSPGRPGRSPCSTTAATSTPAVVGTVLGRTGRSFRFLGKKEVFDAPVIGLPRRRWPAASASTAASGSDEPLEAAIAALEAGEADRPGARGHDPRGPAFFDPELKGRWGAARLAAATGAPVIPVGLWGTEKVWPRNSPAAAARPRRPPGDPACASATPVDVEHRSPDADTKRIMAALVDAAAATRPACSRTPTEDELRATYPPGYRGDPYGRGRPSPRHRHLTATSATEADEPHGTPRARAALRAAGCPTPRR